VAILLLKSAFKLVLRGLSSWRREAGTHSDALVGQGVKCIRYFGTAQLSMSPDSFRSEDVRFLAARPAQFASRGSSFPGIWAGAKIAGRGAKTMAGAGHGHPESAALHFKI
jgi:hypothetical protein